MTVALDKDKTIKKLEDQIQTYEIIAGGDKTNSSKRLVYLAKASATKDILVSFLKKCMEQEKKNG